MHRIIKNNKYVKKLKKCEIYKIKTKEKSKSVKN